MIPPLTCIFQCIKILFSDKHSAMGKWFEFKLQLFMKHEMLSYVTDFT